MRPVLRALVWVWAILMLATTMRYGVLYALSTPPPDGYDELDLARPDRPRLVVTPLAGAPRAGDVVVYTPADGNGTRVARVLFLASHNATGGYDVPALNTSGVHEVEARNRTWALPTTLGNGTGAFVADDRGATPHAEGEPLVGDDHIEGTVARVEDGGVLLMFLALAALGSLVPVVLLVATQRPKRAAGGVWDPALEPPEATVPCPDCGRPVNPTATFCLACGSYLRREDGKEGAP